MLIKEQIEKIKLAQEGRRKIVEIQLSKRNPYELIGFAADDIDQLLETLEKYMDSRKVTMRRPPWSCVAPKCDGLIYTITYNDSGLRKGMFDAKCPKCGNEFCT